MAQVDEILAANHATNLRSVRVQVGPLSCVEPALLVSAWADERCADGLPVVTLQVDNEPLVASCDLCGARFEPVQFCFRCANCGGTETQVISGDGVILHSIEVVDAPDGVLT
jgi:hydrogenase nickel incorporation protein HypA/HybF